MLDLLAAGSGAAGPGPWITMLPWVGIVGIFWFMLIRPQMRQQKAQRAKIAGIKKGDQVITAGGLLAKVVRVDDEYAELEIAPTVRVKALKATIGDVVAPGGKPAND
ncbi:MAG: preprotein translocase subunit YajC [Croceibacterium sp.]